MAGQKYSTHFILLLTATILASGCMGLIGRMTAIAYPMFQEYFQATSLHMQWVMAAPILTASSLILIGGRLGDFFGKRRLFRVGLVVMAIGGLASAIATSINYLIFGQLLIGVGIALSAPSCLSLIKQEISEEMQGESIGLWAGLSGAFGVLGLLSGGVIIEALGWQAIFYSVIPLLGMAFFLIPREKSKNVSIDGKINWLALIAIFICIFFVIFHLIDGNQHAWESVANYVRLIASSLFLLIVVVWQNKMDQPLIPLKVFKNSALLGANLGTFFIYFSLNAIYIFLIFHFQTFYGYSPAEAGWAMLPASLMVTLFASRFGKLGSKVGDWKILRMGAILTTLAFLGFLLPGSEANYYLHFFPSIFILGLGMSLFVSPLTSFALKASSAEIGLASGINNLIARFSGILAIGIIGGVFAIVEDGMEKFRISAIIMAASSALGAMFIFILIPRK